MERFSTRVRLTLAALALAGAMAEVIWLADRTAPGVQQFSLHPTNFALNFTDPAQFPVFDPVRSNWIVGGRPAAVRSFVRDENGSPDGLGKYIVVGVKEPATAEAVRFVLLDLIGNGICQVGIIDTESRVENGMRQVMISRIDWALSREGKRENCKPPIG